MRRFRPLVALLPFALAAVPVLGIAGEVKGAPQFAAPPPAPAAAPAPMVPVSAPAPLLAPGPPPDLDLVFTAQVIGWIEPCG